MLQLTCKWLIILFLIVFSPKSSASSDELKSKITHLLHEAAFEVLQNELNQEPQYQIDFMSLPNDGDVGPHLRAKRSPTTGIPTPTSTLLPAIGDSNYQLPPIPEINGEDREFFNAHHISKTVNVMKTMYSRFNDQMQRIRFFQSMVTSAVKTHGSTVLKHPQVLRDLVSHSAAFLHALKGVKQIQFQGTKLNIHDLRIRTGQLSQILNSMINLVKSVESTYTHIAFRNQPTLMSGTSKISTVHSFAVNSTTLAIASINDLSLGHLLDGTFFLSRPMPVLARKFLPHIQVYGSVSGIINGLDLSLAVLSDRPNWIAAPVALNRLFIRGHLSADSINGLNVAKDIIKLNQGSYRVASPVVFQSPVTFFNSLRTPNIGNINLESFLSRVIISDVEQVITGPILLAGRVFFGHPVESAYFNGLHLNSVTNDLVRLDTQVVSLGSKVFARSVNFPNSLIVDGNVNGIRIPEQLLLTSVPQTISAPKRFVHHHTFESQVVVKRTVDGISIPQDIVTLSGGDHLPVVTFANGIDVFSHVTAGLVDTVDLSVLAYESVKASHGVLFNPILNGPVFVNGDIIVTGPINGQDVSFLARDVIRHYQSGIVAVKGTKFFRGPLSIPAVRVDLLNGHPLSAFASIGGNEVFSHMQFISASFNRTTVKSESVNGINILKLHANRISLYLPGFLPHGINFLHELRVSQGLTLDGSIQNIVPTRDLVLKSAHQEVTGTKHFLNLKIVHSLKSHNGANCRLVDGVNITWIKARSVSLVAPQAMDLTRIVLENSGAQSLMTERIGRISLRDFLPNVMVKSQPQKIASSKRFNGLVSSYNDVTSRYGINGIKLDQLDKHAIHLVGSTTIDRAVIFTENLRVNRDVQVNRLINKISLPDFLPKVLYKTGHSVVQSPVTLYGPLQVLGDINTPSVNNMWIPEVSLLKKYDQTIDAIALIPNITFLRNVIVGGTVNRIDLDRFDRSIMKLDRPNVFPGDLRFETHVQVRLEVNVKGTVSGLDLHRFVHTTMHKFWNQKLDEITLRAPSSFFANLNFLNLNHTNFHQILKSIAFVNERKPFVFTRPVTFATGLVRTHGNVRSESRTIINGATNSIFLPELFRSLAYVNAPAVFNNLIRFTDDVVLRSQVTVAGNINSIDLHTDVLFKVAHPSGRSQKLSGSTTFDSVISEVDLDVLGSVNGMNIYTLVSDSLLETGSQRVIGAKFFNGPVVMESDAIVQNLNQIPNVAVQLIPLNTFQFFRGFITFVNPVQVKGDVLIGGLVAGKNLTDMVKYALYKDQPQVVPGKIEFERLVFQDDVNSAGAINGVFLNKFYRDINAFNRNIRYARDVMANLIDGQLRSNTLIYDSLLSSPFELSYFTLKQELPGVHGRYFESRGPSMYSISELESNGVNSTVYQVRYKREAHSFERHNVGRSVPFVKRVFFKLEGREFSVHRTSHNSESTTEIRLGPNVVARLDPYIDDFTVLATKEMAIVASLIGLKGQIKIHTLKYVGSQLQFNHVAVIKVGPGATKMVLFIADTKLYLAVARSFRGQCSVGDYGSLLFQFISGTFKLVQRLAVNDAHHVIHYEHNKRHFLAFGDGGGSDDLESTQAIHVFTMKHRLSCHLIPFAKLRFENLKDLTVVSFGPMSRETILMAAINSTTVQVWKQEGVFGFSRSWSMPVTNGQAVYPISANNDLFLVASQGNKCQGSLIFQAVFSGASLRPLVFQRHWSSIS